MSRTDRKRPLISANFAMTWDGRISTRRRTPSDFSSAEDKRRFLQIRAEADAVLVTVRTAATDRMTIGIPSPKMRAERVARGQAPYPVRVLVTNRGRIPTDLPVLHQVNAPLLIFCGKQPSRKTMAAVEGRAEIRVNGSGEVDLRGMVEELHKGHGVRRLHCEGGGELLRSLVEADLLDELYLTLCPRIFGSDKAPTVTGALGRPLPASVQMELVSAEPVGDECFLKYRVVRSRGRQS